MRLVWVLLTVYAMVNVIAFTLYGIDKRRAKKNLWRIRERTLFILCFLGGSVAMYITMQLIRHKTRHISFMLGIPFIIAFQALILYAIETFS